jgi:hypothetical protein
VIKDQEIVHGLIKHLSQRAAETLRQDGRKAERLTLEFTFADRTSRVERMHLQASTDEPTELMAAAEELAPKMMLDKAVQSISVHISSVAARPLRQRQEPERVDATLVSAAHALACAR